MTFLVSLLFLPKFVSVCIFYFLLGRNLTPADTSTFVIALQSIIQSVTDEAKMYEHANFDNM